ncbi:FAS1-like dehydratase domain-containing protein, partial [Micrococcus terreus]
FAVIIAQGAEAAAIQDPEANIDFSRVVHADERFTHHRPIVAGDELTATVTVESVKSLGGHSMITTRADIATTAGEPVSAVLSTLLVRGEES